MLTVHRVLTISPPPCFTPCKGSQGHPCSFTSDHIQIVFRKILFSPSWEPASAEGWDGWEGCGRGSLSVLNAALQGRGVGGGASRAHKDRGQWPCPHRLLIPSDLRRRQGGRPCGLQSGKTTTVKPENHLEGELRADGSTSHLLGTCPARALTGKLYQGPSNR